MPSQMDHEPDTTLQIGKLLSIAGDPHGDEFRYEVRAGRIVHPVHGILTNLPVIMERSQVNGDRQSVIAIDPHAVTVLVQRELDNPFLVLSNSRSGSGRERLAPCLPPAGGLGLGSGTTGGRPFRSVAPASPSLG